MAIVSGGTIVNGQYINPDGGKGFVDTPASTNPADYNPNPAMPGATPPTLPPTISSTTTAPTTSPTIPTPAPDTTDHTSGLAGTNASIEVRNQQIKDTLKTEYPGANQSTLDSLFASYLQANPDNPTGTGNVAAYDTATGTTEASRNQAKVDAQNAYNAQQSAVNAKQAEVAGYQAQIKSITDQRDAQNLQLEDTINNNSSGVGGAGAMANSSFLNVRQQEINRRAAIAALPIQGLAQVAQAQLLGLQGQEQQAADVLKQAQDTFDKAFQLKIDDNNKIYDAQQANRKAFYDFMTTAQQNITNQVDKQQTTNRDLINNAINEANTNVRATGDMQALAKLAAIPAPSLIGTPTEVQANIDAYNKKVNEILAGATKKQTPYVTDENGQTVQYLKDASGAIIPSSRTVLGGTNNQTTTSSKEDAKTVIGVDPKTGKQVMVTGGEAKTMGLTNIMDAPSSDISKTLSARQWTALVKGTPNATAPEQMGLLDIVDKLDAKGALGPIASRWNEFLTGTYGGGSSDPEVNNLIEALRVKIGLSQTLLMNLHVGSRGGAYMLEHFENLADAKNLNAAALKTGIKSELNYAEDRSMTPSSGGTPSGSGGADQYASYRSQVKTGEILIQRNGQVGAIPEGEFNSKTDTKL